MVSLVRGSSELNREDEQGQSAVKRRKVEVEVNGEKKIITVEERERVKCSFNGCRKNLNLVTQLANGCLCEGKFCNGHKLYEKHSCTFDWQGRAQDLLEQKKTERVMKHTCLGGFSGGDDCAH